MELPRPHAFKAQGKKPTHDFLSLYSSPVQQDPRPSTPQGASLETHDFLQPLDRVNFTNEGNIIEAESIKKPPPPPSVGHNLPEGIGTYSTSHANQSQNNSIPEGVIFTAMQASSSGRNDENSNCSSFTGSGFTLWEESAMKKEKTGKENIAGDTQVIREARMRIGGLERLSLSSSNHDHQSTTISCHSSSQPSLPQKKQSFVDMINSARSAQEDDDDDDDDEEEIVIKEESSFNHKESYSVKVNRKGTDQKPNTSRSKHSATEQRRRSKINDRFSMLRELIPHGDQKRDKASFLLEVIDYIQYLQEKVHKYEDSYQGWNNGPTKLIPWGNSPRPTEGCPLINAKLDENTTSSVTSTISRNGLNIVESNTKSADKIKDFDKSRLAKNVSPSPVALQSNILTSDESSNVATSLSPRLASTTDDCGSELKEQELRVDSGRICVSTMYSQGLLSTLTHALENSGVDLSLASISVQINLGRRSNCARMMNLSTSIHKEQDDPTSSNQGLLGCSRKASSTGKEFDVQQALKRFKTGIH